MSKKKKYTPDVLAIGVVAFAGGLGLQKLILQPKTEVKISEGFTVPVQGLMPFSQKYVAAIGKKAFNDVLPLTMSASVKVLNFLRAREHFKKAYLWFVYDFMSRYSLNSVVGYIFKKFRIGNRDEYRNIFHDYIQKIITEKTDREAIIRSATEEVMKILRIVTDGTVASLLFNEKFAEAASAAIAVAVNRFIADDAANRVTDYILSFVSQLEDVTLPSFLENTLGIGRTEMGNLIDTVYDAILGQSTINTVRNLHIGNIVHDMINSVDFNRAYEFVPTSKLLKVSAAGAFAAMSFYGAFKKAAHRYYRVRGAASGVRSGVSSLFSNKEFMGDFSYEDEEEEVSYRAPERVRREPADTEFGGQELRDGEAEEGLSEL